MNDEFMYRSFFLVNFGAQGALGGVEGCVRLLLNKNPARSFRCPSCQVRFISLERSPRPWQNESITLIISCGNTGCMNIEFGYLFVSEVAVMFFFCVWSIK